MTEVPDAGAVSRRAALGILAGSAAAVAAAVAGVRFVGSREEEAAAEGLRRIGEAYLARHPEERDVEMLRWEVPAGTAELAAAVSRDFEAGRIEVLSGWHLSLTECRAAAVVVLA